MNIARLSVGLTTPELVIQCSADKIATVIMTKCINTLKNVKPGYIIR